MFLLSPSKDIAVIYQDVEEASYICYDEFLELSNSLQQEIKNIFEVKGVKRAVAVSSDATLQLPVLVHAIIQSSYVLVPFTFNSILCLDLFKRVGTKWIMITILEYQNSCATFKSHIRKMHVIKSFPQYILLELTMMENTHIYDDDLLYIVQSSGSTGVPKLIYVNGSCILPNISDFRHIFSLTVSDVILLPSKITFDASLLLMFLSWQCNSTLLIINKKLMYNPSLFVQSLKMVTVLQCTPSLLHMVGTNLLIENIFTKSTKLRILALGGESFINRNTFIKWLRNTTNQLKVYNLYGISEMSAWASYHQIQFQKNQILQEHYNYDWLPIGKCLSETFIEIRDEKDESISHGYGRIYIGSGTRKGVIEAETFDENIFWRSSGDNAYIENQSIYFCGRDDNCMKRNGQLLSLEMLTKAVRSLEYVENVCRAIHVQRLILFIALKQLRPCQNTEKQVLEFIRKVLSSSYFPDHIEFVKKIPLTGHGKPDIDVLLKEMTVHEGFISDEYVLECWLISLGISRDCVSDKKTFAQLGGDSFAAVYFFNRILKKRNDGQIYENLFTRIFNSTLNEMQHILCSSPMDEKTPVCDQCDISTGPTSNSLETKTDSVDLLETCGHHFLVYVTNGFIACFCKKFVKSGTIPLPLQHTPIKLSIEWKCNLGKCIDSSPLVYFSDAFLKGVVLIGSHSHMFAAISLFDGSTIWKVETQDRIESTATISTDGKVVIFGCYDGIIYFVEVMTGNVVWRFQTKDLVKSSATCYQSLAYIGCHDKHCYALDIRRRKVLWSFFSNSLCCSKALILPDNNIVCFTFLSGKLIALNMQTGSVCWEYKVNKPIFTSPINCGGSVVFGCVDNTFYCIEATGVLAWQYHVSDQIYSSPVVFNHSGKLNILFGCNDGYLYCLDGTGKELWVHNTDSPIVASAGIFHVDNFKINRKRKLLSSMQADSGRRTFLVSINTEGRLTVLCAKNRNIMATFNCSGEVFSSPVVVGNHLLFGCRDDHLYCLLINN